MSLKSQVEFETSLAIREVEKAVHKMVTNSTGLELTTIMAQVKGSLANHSEPMMSHAVTPQLVVDIISAIIAKGFDKMTPLQSIIGGITVKTDLDPKVVLLEVTSAVVTVASYLTLIHVEGSWYVKSLYRNEAIDQAVYDATHPLPSTINLKPLVDIDSNAYRSDSGYRVMLGSKHNKHDNELPMWVLNYLNAVPYSIEDCSHPVRPKPEPKKQYDAETLEKIAYNSLLHTVGTCKGMQCLYEKGNKFYFPHSFCKRERIYSKGFQINLQGTEYDKSVIEFSNKELLTEEGKYWLYVATANVFGMDKEDMSVRVQWVKDNILILETLTDKADEPLLFAKHVRAIRNAQEGKPIGIPVHMDATNSGGQVIGALLADEATLIATNVIPNVDRTRKDLYKEVGESLGTSGLHYERNDVKTAVVPAFYGSEAEPKRVFGEENLPKFWNVLEVNYPSIHWYLKALPQLWRDDITEYSFTLPDGRKVYLPVTGVIEEDVFLESIATNITLAKEVIGRKKKSKCFLAHIVHSLDAYVLRNIVAKCKAHGIDIMVIHDSFGSHPNHMGRITQWYKEELSALILADVLPGILEEIFGHKVVLPVFGDRASLAIQALNAEYPLS